MSIHGTNAGRMRRSPHLEALFPFALWIAGAGIAFGPVLLTGLGVVLSGRGDPRLVHYILEHGYRWLGGWAHHERFWDPPLFHPYPNVSAFTDVLLGAGPFYWPWRWLGGDPDVSLGLWILTVCAANYAAFWWFLRRQFGFEALAAAVGAYLFAFGSIRMANLGHLQVLPQLWVVLGVAAGFAVFDPGSAAVRRRWGIVGFAAAMVLQTYTSFYTAFAFALLSLLIAAVALTRKSTRAIFLGRLREHAPTLVLTGIATAIAMWPIASHYLSAYATFGDYGLDVDNVPRPYAWLLMGPRNLVYGAIQRAGGLLADLRHPNQSNGLGFVTLLAVGLGLYRLRANRSVRLLAAATLLFMLLATAYDSVVPWHVVRAVLPGAGAIRAVGRLGMVLLVPASICLAAAVDWANERWSRPWVAILLALVVVEQAHGTRWIDTGYEQAHIERLVQRMPSDCEAFYLVCRGPNPCRSVHEDAMWMQLATGTPTINGRYGHRPPGFELGKPEATSALRKRELASALDRWAVRYALDRDRLCLVESPGYVGSDPRKVFPWPTWGAVRSALASSNGASVFDP